MRITFLGTGTSQGVPIIGCNCAVCLSADEKDKRLRSSILVELNNKVLVIDTGPDFRQQMLRAQVKKLDAVLYTHEHKDHLGGIDDIRAFNYILKKKMQVYATPQVEKAIKREIPYSFDEHKYPGVPELEITNFDDAPFEVEGVKVIPIKVYHHKLPVYGFRINDFTYITDANFIAADEIEKIKGSKVLVLNALRREKHISHFTLTEAAAMSIKTEVPLTYFTHISHQLGKHADLERELPPHIRPAYDGLILNL
jgi:phosphoribosyl 1,2-cyclic phosphate phosphodiesterase